MTGSLPRLATSSSLLGVLTPSSLLLLAAVAVLELFEPGSVIPRRAAVQSWLRLAVDGVTVVEEDALVVERAWRGAVGNGEEEETGLGSWMTSDAYGLVHAAAVPPRPPVPFATTAGLPAGPPLPRSTGRVALVCLEPSSICWLMSGCSRAP